MVPDKDIQYDITLRACSLNEYSGISYLHGIINSRAYLVDGNILLQNFESDL